jgi:cobalt-zinc-cadmium efflux system membrane fusion protein
MKQLFIIACSFLILSCTNKTDEKQENKPDAANNISLTPEQLKNAEVDTGNLTQRSIATMLRLNGRIDVPPQNIVSISVPMGGYLKSTHLLPGVFVKKGEVIANMEDQQYIQLQQDFLTAKAKINFLEAEYLRQKELNESKASSDKAFQQAEADYKTHKVLISALNEKLKLVGINTLSLNENNITRSIRITSPINGFSSKVNVNIGKYVAPTDVLFELINPNDIHLNLNVFEKDVNKLYIGQPVISFTNNDTTRKHKGEIILISKNLNQDRSAEVHCHFDSYDKSLLPGTFMNAEVQMSNKNAMTLPENAVVRFQNRSYIFIVIGSNRFEMREVLTGGTENGFIEIMNHPLFANKTIVTKGAYALLMALKNVAEEE